MVRARGRQLEQAVGLPRRRHPGGREIVVPPAAEHVLREAKVWAWRVDAAEPDSEHVLLALADRWSGCPLLNPLTGRGLTAKHVRDHTLAMIRGNDPEKGSSPLGPGPWPLRQTDQPRPRLPTGRPRPLAPPRLS